MKRKESTKIKNALELSEEFGTILLKIELEEPVWKVTAMKRNVFFHNLKPNLFFIVTEVINISRSYEKNSRWRPFSSNPLLFLRRLR